MNALVQDGSITKTFSGNRGITFGNVQYPQNIFTELTAAEKAAHGIYEVIQNNAKQKEGEYYINPKQTYKTIFYIINNIINITKFFYTFLIYASNISNIT